MERISFGIAFYVSNLVHVGSDLDKAPIYITHKRSIWQPIVVKFSTKYFFRSELKYHEFDAYRFSFRYIYSPTLALLYLFFKKYKLLLLSILFARKMFIFFECNPSFKWQCSVNAVVVFFSWYHIKIAF